MVVAVLVTPFVRVAAIIVVGTLGCGDVFGGGCGGVVGGCGGDGDSGPSGPSVYGPVLVLGFTGQSWCSLASPSVYWPVLVFTGQSWCLLARPGVYWTVLVFTGQSWCLLATPGVYWTVLVFTGEPCPVMVQQQSSFSS